MGRVVADWPARLAAHPPTADAALRVALAVSLSFLAFAAHRVRPEGKDLEVGDDLDEARTPVFAEARRISGFRGRLLERPPGFDAAIATRGAVYLPSPICQMAEGIADRHAAEKLAFVIVHEKSHADSMDNAIWSVGSVNSLLVTGLLSALLVPASFPSTLILVPDRLVRTIPLAASVSLAAILAAVGMAAVGAARVGLLTSLSAARECSADAIAAAVVGGLAPALPEGRRGLARGPGP